MLFAALVCACADDVRADGEPCASPFACASGACLAQPSGRRVCARRCASNGDCAAGDVCGRYDFRGRDDGGAPKGPLVDVIRVCRAPLNARCAAGCAASELCSGDGGVCALPCATSADCGGRACVHAACGRGRCAAPCDHGDDCAAGERCDTGVNDTSGHGACVARADGGVAKADAAHCDADP